jgi:hypothetical protein
VNLDIVVPCMMNDSPVRTVHHKNWDTKVRNIAGGLTILKPAKGQWISDSGEHIMERVIPVRIACTESNIKRIAKITSEHYKQEKVLYYCVADKVHFYH